MTTNVTKTPLEQFGKDHFSLLAYSDHCFVELKGILDPRRMRCNPNTHPYNARPGATWQDSHSTILKDGVLSLGHDDWDCLDDWETHGYMELVTMASCCVVLTKKGIELAHKLRQHKANGGRFADFQIE